MLSDPAMVDTNVLVYALYEDSVHYEASQKVLDEAQDGILSLCVAPQGLAEFYAVVTSKRRVTAPYEPGEALELIGDILVMPNMTLLPTPVDVVVRWTELVRQHPVTGSDIFDVQLVATMLGNDVTRIYTFNRGDFERFGEIEVLTP